MVQPKIYGSLLSFAILLSGCGGSKELTKVPEWVNGKVVYEDVIQGVGSAAKMMNPAAQGERAAHQGRLALARTMRTKISGMIRDWVNENQDYFTNSGESLSYFEAASEEITSAVLVGSEIKEYYKDEDGTLYSLAVISRTAAVSDMMDKMKSLSNEQTRIIQERADEAFKKLEEKLEKANW